MTNSADGERAFEVGPLLGDAATLVLRHWLILVLTLAALTASYLLILDLLGHCFASASTACVPAEVFHWFGESADDVRSTVRVWADRFAAFAVRSVVLYFLYSSKDLSARGRPYLRTSYRRVLQFFGRTVFVWLVTSVPNWIIGDVYQAIGYRMIDRGSSLGALWLVFIGFVLLEAAVGAYPAARIAVFVPSAAFDPKPANIRMCMDRARPVRRNLFLVLFTIETGALIVQAALARIFRILDLSTLAAAIAGWSLLPEAYLARILPSTSAYILVSGPTALVFAFVFYLAFQKLSGADDRGSAQVFE